MAGVGGLLSGCATTPPAAAPPPMERIVVSADGRGFAHTPSGRAFVPRGFNYDHDAEGRLIEEYWDSAWARVVEDFGEMAAFGANTVRVHLQFGRFMRGPDEPDPDALDRLAMLLVLAEQKRLYLDLTGLGCYLKNDVPSWYDALTEEARWQAQARFWSAIAARCAPSPAVFCYDLMNEPVVPGGRRKPGDWLGPPFAGKYHYVQFITLALGRRSRPAVARAWIQRLVTAIREHDARRLVTVGLVDWSLDRPGLSSGFVPTEVAPELDFLAVHIYPEGGRVDAALETLAGFAVGKLVLIEETFPLRCGSDDFRTFLRESENFAAGWLGFYWGRTPEEYRESPDIKEQLAGACIELELEALRRTHAVP